MTDEEKEREAKLELSRYIYGKNLTKDDIVEYLCIIFALIKKQSKEIEEIKAKIEKIIQRLEAKPYTAYTLYGDILHESDEIAQMLKEVLEKE